MRVILALMFVLGLTAAASAHEYTVGTLFVHHPAVNATPPGAATAAGYFTIKNNGDTDDALVSVSAPTLAGKAEIHSMSMVDGVMQMRSLKSLPVLAGQEVDMKPEGIHIMFSDLKTTPKDGEKYPATLHFEKAGDVAVYFAGSPIGAKPETMHHDNHPMTDSHGAMDMDPSHGE